MAILCIYFVGAHSTGKSTLARYIAEAYELPLITEVVRELKAKAEIGSLDSLRVDLPAASQFQIDIMAAQMQKERDAGDRFVSDRACDFLAYSALHTLESRDLLQSKECQMYLGDLRIRVIRGKLIFFVRPHKSLVRLDHDRSVMDCEWDEVCRVDGAIEMLLETQGIPYFPVHSRSMRDRVRLVGGIIELAEDRSHA